MLTILSSESIPGHETRFGDVVQWQAPIFLVDFQFDFAAADADQRAAKSAAPILGMRQLDPDLFADKPLEVFLSPQPPIDSGLKF